METGNLFIILFFTFLFVGIVVFHIYTIRRKRRCKTDVIAILPPQPAPAPSPSAPTYTQIEFREILLDRIYILSYPFPVDGSGNLPNWIKLRDSIVVLNENEGTLGVGGYLVKWDAEFKTFYVFTTYPSTPFPAEQGGIWISNEPNTTFSVSFGAGPGLLLGDGIPTPFYTKTNLPVSGGYIEYNFSEGVDFVNQYIYILFSDEL